MKVTPEGVISSVKKNSLCDLAGIVAGERLCAIDDMPLRDILDVSFAAADSYITLTIKSVTGEIRKVDIEKDPDEDLGLSFENAVFDNIHLCQNRCEFCFVDRMIPGLRRGLYVRDDDYRLSFLYGNFITLTNMKEEDFQRIIQTHMTPLYVSVHATTPEVRRKMMHNLHAGRIMEDLQRLFDAGIHIHAQIVCCPGLNNGKVLEKSFRDLFALSDYVEDMAVVPVGLTKHAKGVPELEMFNKETAAEVVDSVTEWQKECRRKLGKSFIYLGDEFYVLAGREIPEEEIYDGFPQLENGIGLSRSFICDWEKAVEVNTASESCRTGNCLIPVGVSAYGILTPIIREFNEKHGTAHELVSVPNDFFGRTINVTGLLTGGDILRNVEEKRTVILPAVVLNSDNMFLDDMSLAEFKDRATAPVKIAATAAELHHLLLQ